MALHTVICENYRLLRHLFLAHLAEAVVETPTPFASIPKLMQLNYRKFSRSVATYIHLLLHYFFDNSSRALQCA